MATRYHPDYLSQQTSRFSLTRTTSRFSRAAQKWLLRLLPKGIPPFSLSLGSAYRRSFLRRHFLNYFIISKDVVKGYPHFFQNFIRLSVHFLYDIIQKMQNSAGPLYTKLVSPPNFMEKTK